jgi:hypothetical protein
MERDEIDSVARCRVGHVLRRLSTPLCQRHHLARLAPPAAVSEMPCAALPRPRSTPAALSEMPRAASASLRACYPVGDASCRPLLSQRRLAPRCLGLTPPVNDPASEPSPVASPTSHRRPLRLETSMQMREEERMRYEGRGRK